MWLSLHIVSFFTKSVTITLLQFSNENELVKTKKEDFFVGKNTDKVYSNNRRFGYKNL